MIDLKLLGESAKTASAFLLKKTDKEINSALLAVATALRQNSAYLIEQNALDIKAVEEKGYPKSLLDRLTLTNKIIEGMAVGIEQVAKLKSPLYKTIYKYTGQDGIKIRQIAVPFGVIGIIYESRPNVTADAFALCFKTANAVILKGGSDAINSNIAIVKVIKDALKSANFDENAVNLIEDTTRETTKEFVKLKKYVDLLIPRGSASLINFALENATIPIIETGTGNCHIYVDEFADVDKAVAIIFNAKTQRLGVCNACESLVIHSAILGALPKISAKLKEKNVEMRCDKRSKLVLEDAVDATEEDFYTEYLDTIISVKTVDSIDEAIAHINEHGTKHSEAIITENKENAEKFLNEVDAAAVYHNVSTRFTDGFEFGLGAEIGISTQKLHARGPMGLNALVTTKYLIKGNGVCRK